MADPKEDKIDFSKLEKELQSAVESDAKYWRENDAKLRAVSQRVETYDQFRDMVAAAHIKPLDKKDKIGQGKRSQPWNPFSTAATSVSTHDTSVSGDSVVNTKANVVIPKNGHEFTKEWWKIKKSSSDCYSYLLHIGGQRLLQVFISEISFGLLGEIIKVLNENCQESDCSKVLEMLRCLARAGRFGLSLDFLSKAEIQNLTTLFTKLEQWSRTCDNCSAEDEEMEEEIVNLTKENKDQSNEKKQPMKVSRTTVEDLKRTYKLSVD